MSVLTVEFAGETVQVASSLTFGRSGQLEIDQNEFMHRIVGEFVLDRGLWWLRNRGSRIPLTIIAADGKRVELPPGAVQVLSGGSGVVRFRAGQANYELEFSGAEADLARPESAGNDTGRATLDVHQTARLRVDLTPREVDFLVCFCASQFGQSASTGLPSYAQVAATWGVSVKTLDNTMQNLRRKVKEAGLAGVDSADALVAFVLSHGLIRPADLDWAALNEPHGPRPAAQGPRFANT